jgi:hypothetical protein
MLVLIACSASLSAIWTPVYLISPEPNHGLSARQVAALGLHGYTRFYAKHIAPVSDYGEKLLWREYASHRREHNRQQLRTLNRADRRLARQVTAALEEWEADVVYLTGYVSQAGSWKVKGYIEDQARPSRADLAGYLIEVYRSKKHAGEGKDADLNRVLVRARKTTDTLIHNAQRAPKDSPYYADARRIVPGMMKSLRNAMGTLEARLPALPIYAQKRAATHLRTFLNRQGQWGRG